MCTIAAGYFKACQAERELLLVMLVPEMVLSQHCWAAKWGCRSCAVPGAVVGWGSGGSVFASSDSGTSSLPPAQGAASGFAKQQLRCTSVCSHQMLLFFCLNRIPEFYLLITRPIYNKGVVEGKQHVQALQCLSQPLQVEE